MEPHDARVQTLDFLHRLWAEKPATAAVQLWEKRTKLNSTFDDLDLAATYATEQAGRGDLYMATGLSLRRGAPSRRRATAQTVVAIPGLWADIDLNGGPEAKADAAPDLDAALELAHELLEPTVLVRSGHGLQAWWLLEEPWVFDADGHQREQAHRLSVGFQAALRARARARGFGLDSTFDLARLMRVPGTLNHKGQPPVPVELLDHDGPRHQQEALHRIASAHMAQAGNLLAELTGQGIEIHVNGTGPQPPWPRLNELMAIDPDFMAVWTRQHKPGDGSHSSVDLSLTNKLVAAGFTDQEIAECIRWQRNTYDAGSGKGERVDYLQKTIAKARNGERLQQREAEKEAERNESIEHMGRVADSEPGEVPADTIVAIFDRLVGGPSIKEVVQDGIDYETGRFKLVLADGREVPLGTVKGLTNQQEFRDRFLAHTQFYPPLIKVTKEQPIGWDKIVRGLMLAAQVNDTPDDLRQTRATEWVRAYTKQHLSTDRDMACEARDPFVSDDEVYVHSDSLLQWLRRAQGERIGKADLRVLLKAAGFDSSRINYHNSKGTRTQLWYWHAPADLLDGDQPKEATDDES